jgi:uncharacterized protein
VMCPQDLRVSDTLKQSINNTKQLFLELDLDDQSLLMKMANLMMVKDSTQTLEKLLGKVKYDSIINILKKDNPMAPFMASKMKPFALLSLTYKTLLNCEPGSWDMEVMKVAKANKEEVFGLETVEDQMSALSSMPESEQANMLYKTVFNRDSSASMFMKMLDAYKKRDLNWLSKLITGDKDYGKYETQLLEKRNKKWIPVIEQQAKQMPTFFAFGAGHLGGVYGVINLLRKRGYKVTPINY